MARPEARPSLAATQQRLWRLIVAPEGVGAALREAPTPALSELVRSDETLGAEDRLGVYANAYFERILHCLEGDFGALRAALGEPAFRDLATSYLAVHPPEHFSLRYAGARLAGFLSDHAAGAPFLRRWPFGADLARLEWAIAFAFDADDSPVARREQLAPLDPERWAELELALVPALRVIEVDWPVHELRSKHEARQHEARQHEARQHEARQLDEGPLEVPTARAACICVWRESERVYHRELDPAEAAALRTVEQGARFGELCDLAAAESGEEQAAARAAGWLARWLDDGLLCTAEVPS